jgi:hypothetical protein
MLQYINEELCAATDALRAVRSSTSFYYKIPLCGSAAQKG